MTLTPIETIRYLKEPVQAITRGWMLAPETDRYGLDLGFATGGQFWLLGRSGVIGDASADVLEAAIAFEGSRPVREALAAMPPGLTPSTVADHYLQCINAWGIKAFADADVQRLERLDDLVRRIVDAAPLAVGVLFAGWRAAAVPSEVGARVALSVHLLRELRGAFHLHAIFSRGLSPVEAVLAATHDPPRTGPGYALKLGFEGPFRDPEEVRPQRVEAEFLTEDLLVPYFNVVSGADRSELVDLMSWASEVSTTND